jgi:hypothetical protein
MKLRTIRMVVLSSLVLATPSLTLAGGPDHYRMLSKSEMKDLTGATRAVQQGKGSGLSRNQVIQANAYRAQTAQENPAAADNSGTTHSNRSDTAFRK